MLEYKYIIRGDHGATTQWEGGDNRQASLRGLKQGDHLLITDAHFGSTG
jgi:hypothetical protein